MIELVPLKQYDIKSGSELTEIILENSLFEYGPLTAATLQLLFRHIRPFHETVSIFEDLQLLMDEESVKTFSTIANGLAEIKAIIKNNNITAQEAPIIIRVDIILLYI